MENLTTFAALVAALAAIIAPIATALITEYWRTKQKALELLFNEKLTAYREFLDHSGRFFNNPLNSEFLNNMRCTMDRVRLLASPQTDMAICAFLTLLFDIDPPAYSSEQMEQISKAHETVILSLREELSAYDLYKSKSRRICRNNKPSKYG